MDLKSQLGITRWVALLVVPLMIMGIFGAALFKWRPRVSVQLRTVETVLPNPLTGWVPSARWPLEDTRVDFSMVLADVTWRELEPSPGVYDFETLESENQLAGWWQQGKRTILRVLADRPGDADHIDIPDWLYEAMEGAGTHYDTELGKGFSPDYMHPEFISRHWNMLQALGARYDKDELISFVILGSVGPDGEWAPIMAEDAPVTPLGDIAEEYIWHYYSAFESKPMMLPRPFYQGRVYGMGLYNPNLGDIDASWDWLGEAGLGGWDSKAQAELAAMPSAWRTRPVGAMLDRLSASAMLNVGLPALLRQIREEHLSFIISDITPEELDASTIAGIQWLSRSVGYRLWLERARWTSELRVGERLVIRSSWRNDGVAPMYHDWPVELSLTTDSGVAAKARTRPDVRKLRPGSTGALMELDIPTSLAPGTYTVCVAILNPGSGQPAVRLAMRDERDDLRYPIGEVTIKQ